MKKNFAQPEMMVVRMKRNDIITDSWILNGEQIINNANGVLAPGRFDVWYEGE